jgi:hypothetical protein
MTDRDFLRLHLRHMQGSSMTSRTLESENILQLLGRNLATVYYGTSGQERQLPRKQIHKLTSGCIGLMWLAALHVRDEDKSVILLHIITARTLLQSSLVSHCAANNGFQTRFATRGTDLPASRYDLQ